MMKQEGELVIGDGCDGVRVDITRDPSVTDSDHGKLLRNTDPGDRVVEDDMHRDVSAVCYLEPVFARARLANRFVSKDLNIELLGELSLANFLNRRECEFYLRHLSV